jgi:hypothetical protein
MTSIYICGFIVACLVASAIYQVQRERRLCAMFMADLKQQNRANIDAPGWEKKKWQHDRGECPEKCLEQAARIEAFARGTAVQSTEKNTHTKT